MSSNLFKVICYDLYGHSHDKDFTDFNDAVNWALEQFKNVDYCIVRMVSSYQDNDVFYMSKVGY